MNVRNTAASLILLSSIAAYSQPARSLDYNGSEVLRDCTSQTVRLHCIGFVFGVMQTVDVMRALGRLDPSPFCEPEGLDMGRLTDMFVKYLEDNPANRHRPAVVLLFNAMAAAYPCAQK